MQETFKRRADRFLKAKNENLLFIRVVNGTQDTGWWWLEHDFYFPILIGSHHSNWLIFFKGVETTAAEIAISIVDFCWFGKSTAFYRHLRRAKVCLSWGPKNLLQDGMVYFQTGTKSVRWLLWSFDWCWMVMTWSPCHEEIPHAFHGSRFGGIKGAMDW